jgi:hypothetical protein
MIFLVKKMTCLSVGVLLAASASSGVGVAQTIKRNTVNEEFASTICPLMGILATVIMQLRQNGINMNVVIEKLTEHAKTPDKKRLIMDMIISAYQLPQMRVAENKSGAVVEFSNNYQVACYTRDWVAEGYATN